MEERGILEAGGGPGQVGPGRGALLHLPVAMAPTDIFPTAPCLGGIIAHDYWEDQRDRLSLIWPTSVAVAILAVTSIGRDVRS